MTARAPVRLRFTRAMRLVHSRDFAEIRNRGRRITQGCLVANWIDLPEGSPPRLGVVTGKKIGGAVIRSRARRLLREAFRLHQHEFRAPVAVVLVARPSIAGKSLAEVERDFLTALRRGSLLRVKE